MQQHPSLHPARSEPPSLLSFPSTVPNSSANPLHQFYHQLLSDCDYPLLKRILFLQLVTKQNVLLYSKRRAQVKQAWIGLEKKIQKGRGRDKNGRTTGGVFLVDQNTRIQDIFKERQEMLPSIQPNTQKSSQNIPPPQSPPEKQILIFDLSAVNTPSLNYLLNADLTNFTILAIQPQSRPIRAELSDIFPLVFWDRYPEDTEESIEYNQKLGDFKFDRQKFEYGRQINFNLSLEASKRGEDHFFKAYVSLLKEKIAQKNVVLPHSRWKKMIKIIHLIGITRVEYLFKTLGAVDCLLAPECLGRTPEELQEIYQANEITLLQLVPYYGVERWLKQLKHHFWIPNQRKVYFLSLFDKIRGKASFYYPCVKFPEIVSLVHTQESQTSSSSHYKIRGRQKKLLSDKYYKIDPSSPDKLYKLTLKYRSKDLCFTHIGVACYDQKRNMISPVQVCRVEGSEVRFEGLEGDQLRVGRVKRQNNINEGSKQEGKEGEKQAFGLEKWKNQESFGFQRCVGIYIDGNTDVPLPIQHILSECPQPYGKTPASGAYSSISATSIRLSPSSLSTFHRLLPSLNPKTTILMNHYQGGTYVLGSTISQKKEEWIDIVMTFQGSGRENNGRMFLLGTKQIRIAILSNFNSGYPDFKIDKKDAEIQIKDIQWTG